MKGFASVVSGASAEAQSSTGASLYYQKLGLTSAGVAAIVAQAIIHDIEVNNLGLEGFPQIKVSHDGAASIFTICLWWEGFEFSFQLSDAEAIAAWKEFKSKPKTFHGASFDRIQNALANLEGHYANRPDG